MGMGAKDWGIIFGVGWDGEGSAMSFCFVESLLAERKKEKIVKVKFELKIKYTYRNSLSTPRVALGS